MRLVWSGAEGPPVPEAEPGRKWEVIVNNRIVPFVTLADEELGVVIKLRQRKGFAYLDPITMGYAARRVIKGVVVIKQILDTRGARLNHA